MNKIGIEKLLIWLAVLAVLAIMVSGVVSLNHIAQRLDGVEARMNNVINELYNLSGDTSNGILNRGSLAGIEERLDAIATKLP